MTPKDATRPDVASPPLYDARTVADGYDYGIEMVGGETEMTWTNKGMSAPEKCPACGSANIASDSLLGYYCQSCDHDWFASFTWTKKGDFEQLPETSRRTCDLAAFGWSRDSHNDSRCGKKAIATLNQTCGCGSNDMGIDLCAEHYEKVGENGSIAGLHGLIKDDAFEKLIAEARSDGAQQKYEESKKLQPKLKLCDIAGTITVLSFPWEEMRQLLGRYTVRWKGKHYRTASMGNFGEGYEAKFEEIVDGLRDYEKAQAQFEVPDNRQ